MIEIEQLKKVERFILEVCYKFIQTYQKNLNILNSPQEKVLFLLEKMWNIQVEVSNEMKTQFNLFNLTMILRWNSFEANFKKYIYVFGLKNKIPFINTLEYFNYLQKNNPLSFKDIIANNFLLSLINKLFSSQKIVEKSWDKFDRIVIQQQLVLHRNKVLDDNFHIQENENWFYTFYKLVVSESVNYVQVTPETKKVIIKWEVARLFWLTPNGLYNIFLFNSLIPSSSFEKQFTSVFYNDGIKKEELNIDFNYEEYQRKEEIITKKTAEKFFSFNYPVSVEKEFKLFFWKLSWAILPLLRRFKEQYITKWLFQYEETPYQEILTLVSRWIKFSLLYFSKEFNGNDDYEELFSLILFFLEYHKLHWKFPTKSTKIGFISFHTPYTEELFLRTLDKTQTPQQNKIAFRNYLRNEHQFDLFWYEEITGNVLVNPIKEIEWITLSTFKWFLKKINHLQTIPYMPKTVDEAKELYFSDNYQYFLTYWLNEEIKTTLRIKNKDFQNTLPQPQEKKWILNIFSSKKQWEIPVSTIWESLNLIKPYYPLKNCSKEILNTPYSFLKNYQNPVFPLLWFSEFKTQSFYQVLVLNQKISQLKSYFLIMYWVILRNFSILSSWYTIDYHNMNELITFNKGIEKQEIAFQTVVSDELSIMLSKELHIEKVGTVWMKILI